MGRSEFAGRLNEHIDDTVVEWQRAGAGLGELADDRSLRKALELIAQWLNAPSDETLREIVEAPPFGDGTAIRPAAVTALASLGIALRSGLGSDSGSGDAIDRLISVLSGAVSRELAANEDRLWSLAATDALTGAMSRHAVLNSLDAEIARTVRHGRPLSVVYIDVDALKATNDRDGHPAGDRLLTGVVAVVRDNTRVSDLIGRLGGDEFLLVLPDTPVEGAEVVAAKLVKLARAAGRSISVGAAGTPRDQLDRDELIAKADAALRQARGDRGRGDRAAG